ALCRLLKQEEPISAARVEALLQRGAPVAPAGVAAVMPVTVAPVCLQAYDRLLQAPLALAGTAALGTAALGTAALGTAALGTAALGTAALGTAALGTAALGTAALGTAALGTAGEVAA